MKCDDNENNAENSDNDENNDDNENNAENSDNDENNAENSDNDENNAENSDNDENNDECGRRWDDKCDYDYVEKNIIPSIYEKYLNLLKLPQDILRHIGEFLKVRITRKTIERIYTDLYDDSKLHLLESNIGFINKYAPHYKYKFDFFTCWRFWYDEKRFGNLFLRLFYINAHNTKNNSLITTFITNIINAQDYLILHGDVEFWGCPYAFTDKRKELIASLLECLFCIIFTPKYFYDQIELVLKESRVEIFKYKSQMIKEQDTINTLPYLNLLKYLLLNGSHEVIIEPDLSESYIRFEREDEKGYRIQLTDIFDILWKWDDETLIPYVSRIISKIKYDENDVDDCAHKRAIYYFYNIFNDRGYLLLNTLFGNSLFVKYFMSAIAISLSRLILNKIMEAEKYKNICKVLESPNVLAVSIEKRNFKLTKYLFNKHKKKNKKRYASFRNKNNEDLLEIACNSRGLNQNIISLLLDSKLFNSKLKIKNRKVKKIF
jgi:hypothetical protein